MAKSGATTWSAWTGRSAAPARPIRQARGAGSMRFEAAGRALRRLPRSARRAGGRLQAEVRRTGAAAVARRPPAGGSGHGSARSCSCIAATCCGATSRTRWCCARPASPWSPPVARRRRSSRSRSTSTTACATSRRRVGAPANSRRHSPRIRHCTSPTKIWPRIRRRNAIACSISLGWARWRCGSRPRRSCGSRRRRWCLNYDEVRAALQAAGESRLSESARVAAQQRIRD